MEQLTLDGGVDLSHSAPATPAGKLRECLNYEVGWERGYSRVAGFERFDGNTSPSTTTGWVIGPVPEADVSYDTYPAPPTNLAWAFEGESGDAGTLVSAELDVDPDDPGWTFVVFFRSGRRRPEIGATITDAASGLSFVLAESLSVVLYETTFASHDDYLTGLDEIATTLRNNVAAVPGGGTIVGVHWHEDRLYAVRDVQSITLNDTDYPKLTEGMYVYNNAGQTGQVVGKDPDQNRVEIAPVTEAGFVLEATDNVSISLQFRYKEGTAPIFEPGDTIIVDGLGAYVAGYVGVSAGSWDTGSATGDMALNVGADLSPAVDTVVYVVPGGDFSGDLGACKVETLYFNCRDQEVTAVTATQRSTIATLWRSSDEGWVPAETSRTLAFADGVQDPFGTTPVTTTVEMTLGRVGPFGATEINGWTATTQAGSSPTPAEMLAAMVTDDTENAAASITGQLYAGGPFIGLPTLQLAQWQLESPIPTTATVNAISLGFRMRANDAGASLRLTNVAPASPTLSTSIPTVEAMVWIGEDGGGNPIEDWNKDWTPADLNAGNFVFKIDGLYPFGSGASTTLRIDEVKAKVEYDLLPGTSLFVYDPAAAADVGTIEVGAVTLESGAWADGDAAGFFTLDDWTAVSLPPGSQLYTEAGAAGVLIATVVGNVIPISLPGSLALREAQSKYQFISYNFYAAEDRNAIYGCSGAGPAFVYEPEANTLQFINTGVEDTDTPRHLAAHQSRLALGYPWGEVYVSAPGEPLNFDGVDFAATFGFGDKVTGLMPTVGDALAVFTESAVWALTGANGDDSNPPRQQIVNARMGAIEYTVQSMGNRPIYASFRGVETLETTEQYGEFFTVPNTYDISPWLLERLQTASGVEATDKSVVNSVVVRNKNQYRLFFADGFVMTLTLVGVERDPQNTIQYYYFNGDTDQYARCFATASGVTSDGRDRAFFTVEERPLAPGVGSDLPMEPLDYVYELDRGRSFDGEEIAAYFTLSYNLGQQQQAGFASKRYNCIQMHGKVPGYASLRLSRATMYEDLDDPALNYEAVPLGSLEAAPENMLKAKYTKGRLSGRGFAISLRVNHASAREFPHVLQHVTFIDDDPRRVDR